MKAAGVREKTNNAPVTPDTVFRIASMTKSFTAMAILKLRDDGNSRSTIRRRVTFPELANLPYPTNDSPAITIRHLLTHSEGFPKTIRGAIDSWANPTKRCARGCVRAFRFPPRPAPLSNIQTTAFAILGQIVAKASGRPYADYVRDNILRPLGMNSSDVRNVGGASRAHRARLSLRRQRLETRTDPGAWLVRRDGWTLDQRHDLARYVAFLMSAFPPRDEPERGPIKRSSAREMQQVWRFHRVARFAATVDAPLQLGAGGYGYGLGVSQDCRFARHWSWRRAAGLRFADALVAGIWRRTDRDEQPDVRGFSGLFNERSSRSHRTGALQPRVVQPSPALLRRNQTFRN